MDIQSWFMATGPALFNANRLLPKAKSAINVTRRKLVSTIGGLRAIAAAARAGDPLAPVVEHEDAGAVVARRVVLMHREQLKVGTKAPPNHRSIRLMTGEIGPGGQA